MNDLERTTEQVPVLNATPFVVFIVEGAVRPPKRSITLVVKATFALPGCEVVAEQRPPEGDVRVGEDDDLDAPIVYASDFAPFKKRADVTLSGHGYPAEEGDTTGVAQLTLGELSRQVALFGPRRWDAAGAQTDPEPLSCVPLNHLFAFGGKGIDGNPAGCGRRGERLPQIEDPKHLMRSAADSPPVACFAPVPAGWSMRKRCLGTYDPSWLGRRWPYFADDFDWAYFNAAPMQLQTDYLRGDECFRLVGVRPHGEVVDGRLPGVVPEAHARRTQSSGGGLVAIPMNLDTVHFDSDALEVAVVWRGIVEIEDAEGSELAALFVYARPLDAQPASEQDVAGAMLAAWREQEGEQEAPDKELGEAEAERIDDEPLPPAPAPVSRERIVAALEADHSLAEADLSRADLSQLDFTGRDLTAAILTGANLTGARFAGAKLAGAFLDGALAEDCNFAGADLTEADATAANFGAACFDGACLRDASFAHCALQRASLRTVDATGTTMTHVEASDAVFAGATLTSCDLSGATLEGATFDAAAIDDAMFYDANANRASFVEARGEDLRMDDVSLSEATLTSMRAPGASFEHADLRGARLSASVMPNANFARAHLDGTIMDGCDLRASSFRRARLVGAMLAGSDLMQADFQDADLSGADVRNANLYQAETWGAVLDGSVLDGAIVSGTKL